jgi:ferrous iron transport protein B
VVVDATNLKRNMFLFTQVYDLGLPVILALNMVDLVERLGMKVDAAGLSKKFGVPVIGINARKGKGVPELKEALLQNDLKAGQSEFLMLKLFCPILLMKHSGS